MKASEREGWGGGEGEREREREEGGRRGCSTDTKEIQDVGMTLHIIEMMLHSLVCPIHRQFTGSWKTPREYINYLRKGVFVGYRRQLSKVIKISVGKTSRRRKYVSVRFEYFVTIFIDIVIISYSSDVVREILKRL